MLVYIWSRKNNSIKRGGRRGWGREKRRKEKEQVFRLKLISPKGLTVKSVTEHMWNMWCPSVIQQISENMKRKRSPPHTAELQNCT